jgi:hypothetical protein
MIAQHQLGRVGGEEDLPSRVVDVVLAFEEMAFDVAQDVTSADLVLR